MERFTSSWKYIPSTLRSLAAKTYGYLVPESDRNLKANYLHSRKWPHGTPLCVVSNVVYP